MGKVEQFIQDCTNNCSNEMTFEDGSGSHNYVPWLTPEQALKAAEIARGETLQEVKEKLLIMLNTSIDNKHFFEQLDDYIDELKTSNER